MVKNQKHVLKMKDDIMFKAFFSKKGNEIYLKEFLNAILGKEIKVKRVMHDVRLEQLVREQKYGVLDFDVELESGEIVNVEMQIKFRNQNPDMTIPINQWLAFIDMEKGELLEMAEKENKLIKKAKENYDVLIGDEEVKRLAEIRLMSQLEEQAALETARANGARKGMELGKKEEKIETAKKLKKLKMPIEKIGEITGLSEEEIRKI